MKSNYKPQACYPEAIRLLEAGQVQLACGGFYFEKGRLWNRKRMVRAHDYIELQGNMSLMQ